MNSLARIIRNEKYIGKVTSHGTVYTNVIPPIVDEELFYECNAIMDKHKHKPRDSKSEQPYILSGKLFCGFCGSLMTAETGTSHTGKLHHYYKCFGRKRNKHSCKKANYRQQDLEDLVFGTTVKYVLQPDVIQTVAEQVVSKFNSEITKTATLENLENELKAKEKAINALLAAIEQGIVTKSTKERLISLETQKEELESKISLEKARQIKPLEVDKVKAFLTYFARKKYENGQEKNEFFNSFINRVILYDDKILIFYNTDDNHPTVIKRKDTEELISHLNDIASNVKAATNDCLNAMGNNSPIVQKENSLEPQGFKRVSLGGEAGICLIASTELARNATRQPGGDRVRQRRCQRIYDMREIPQNGNKKALFPECLICLAEKQGFEPWLRFSRTTPLAGEPLRPLGYFSVSAEISIFSLLIISQRRRVVNNFGSFGRENLNGAIKGLFCHFDVHLAHTLHFVANLFEIAMSAVHEHVVEDVVERVENIRSARRKRGYILKEFVLVGDENYGDVFHNVF